MAQQIGLFVNPVLEALRQLGGSGKPSEVCAAVSRNLKLDGSVLEETLKSGESRFTNKIRFVRLYLVASGYIDKSVRGTWTLTEKGLKARRLTDTEVQKLLQDVQQAATKADGDIPPASPDLPPPNQRESIEGEDVTDYRANLLDILRALPPAGFERLCQRLLRESGFEQVEVTGRSGDGGIDGIGVLKVNTFVTFKVLFQCKRYSGTVGSGEVRNFRGAMQGRSDKGIFLTTGAFSTEAHREAIRDGVPPIELVDGEQLVQLFEQLELGLTPRTTYDVDDAFFDQYRT